MSIIWKYIVEGPDGNKWEKAWGHFVGLFVLFVVPIIIYLFVKWDPSISIRHGEPITLGVWVILVFYWIGLFFIYKHKSESMLRKYQLKRLLKGEMDEKEQKFITEELQGKQAEDENAAAGPPARTDEEGRIAWENIINNIPPREAEAKAQADIQTRNEAASIEMNKAAEELQEKQTLETQIAQETLTPQEEARMKADVAAGGEKLTPVEEVIQRQIESGKEITDADIEEVVLAQMEETVSPEIVPTPEVKTVEAKRIITDEMLKNAEARLKGKF